MGLLKKIIEKLTNGQVAPQRETVPPYSQLSDPKPDSTFALSYHIITEGLLLLLF